MQVKLLEALIEELASPGAGKIVKILFNKKDVNEFLIAKKMTLTINQVRNILYKLSAEGLVSFIRKKDKKKGWYIYFWTLNTEKCLVMLEHDLMKRIEKLNEKLKARELKNYYFCKSCGVEVGEETALEHNFSCEECAEIYTLADKEKPLREIKARISRRERELKIIQTELVSIRQKNAKKREKIEKKEKKKKPVKRKLKRSKKSRKRMQRVLKAVRKGVSKSKKSGKSKKKHAKKKKKSSKKVKKKHAKKKIAHKSH